MYTYIHIYNHLAKIFISLICGGRKLMIFILKSNYCTEQLMVRIVCRFGNLKVFLSLLSLAFLSVENVHQMFMFNWFTDCLWILFLSNYKVMSFHLAATSYTCKCS